VGVLVGIQGPLKGQLYKVQDGENKVGREGCEVLLADPTKRISRFHAKITHMEGALVIEANPDVMENNPTYLNDDAIDAEALNDGDILRFGDCTFKFRTI
jgi:predicted component of type VI protein secretion system